MYPEHNEEGLNSTYLSVVVAGLGTSTESPKIRPDCEAVNESFTQKTDNLPFPSLVVA